MKNELVSTLSRSIHKIGFKFKKHSPEILVVAGVVGIVTSTVMACKATTKVNDIVDEAKETIEKIHDSVDKGLHTSDGEEYTQEVAKKDLTIVYAQTGWKFVKLYAPAVAVGTAAIACMLGSNHILRNRNVALAAALTNMATSFKDYRTRLVDKFGPELDRELRFGIKAKEVERRIIDEDGNETTVTETVEVIDPNAAHSIYSVVFCEGNTGWTRNPELNKVFLIQQQNQANDRLRMNQILTLNEVYDMVGAPRTAYGQRAGWVWTEDGSIGNNYVDFGIFDVYNEKACDFLNGREKSVILDFNCIGDVLPYM